MDKTQSKEENISHTHRQLNKSAADIGKIVPYRQEKHRQKRRQQNRTEFKTQVSRGH